MLLGVVAPLRMHLVNVSVLPVWIHKVVELVITSILVLQLDHLIQYLNDNHFVRVSAGGINMLHVLALHPLVVMEAHAVQIQLVWSVLLVVLLVTGLQLLKAF